MGDMESYKVMLNGPAPWGFRLQGGKDFSMPLSISRLTLGGKAAQAGVGVGDWVLYIDGESTSAMTHIEAQNRIRACGDRLCLTLSRAQNQLGKPQKDSLPCSEPLKYNFAPSTALNKTARPFGAAPPAAGAPQQPPQPLQPPSTPGCDPGKLRMLEDAEDWQPRTGTSQSRSFHKLAQLTGTGGSEFPQGLALPGDVGLFWGNQELGGAWRMVRMNLLKSPGVNTVSISTRLVRLWGCGCVWGGMDWSNTDCCATILSDTTGMPMGPTGARGSIGECQVLAEVLACARASLGMLPCSRAGSSPGAELLPSVTHRQPPQPLEPPSDSVCDPVKLKMLEDIVDTKPHTWTSQSRSFRKLARMVGASSMDEGDDEPVKKPRDSHGSIWGIVEQREPLEPPSTPGCDPGKLRLMEDAEGWQPRTGTSQSRSFRKLAQLTGTDEMEDGVDEIVKKPRDARGSSWGTVEQRQPPQPLEPPSTPGCNPGKLRLMEDAEDWQPRTGTSQSRSFRKLAQLTGTDEMEDHDDVFVRKPSQVSVPDPSPGATMKTEPGLAPRTPSASPSPTSRPPWAVDPSFAERYAPDKTSTVVSKHSQPATPTPMQNRSSIVQAAQQAPEGPGRTPLCYKCNKVIRGRYLVALGHYYHPEEFVCCQCRKVLDEGGFFEEKGSIFCPKCYDTRYAPTCAKCKKKITGEVMHALKMTWHVQCFTCNACKTPIRNRAFYMEEGQPYCERDYEKMFGTKCRGCDFKIDAGDRFLEALGFSWHDTCFVCAICQTNLEGKTFYSKKDKPLCKSHAFSHV
nr:PDZ and LIM domain protein 7 [Zonotrichia albicollis]